MHVSKTARFVWSDGVICITFIVICVFTEIGKPVVLWSEPNWNQNHGYQFAKIVLLCRNSASIKAQVNTQNRVKHRVWHIDPWPDPAKIANLVTHDLENQFYLWLIMKRVLHLCQDDWSWRVRYAAVIGLVKVCQGTSQDSLKDGLRTIAWNTLRKAGSVEKDGRVLKALKVLSVMAFFV